MKKSQKLKVTYRYIKPKTKEEKMEAQMRLDRVFDRLFEEVLQSDEWKQRIANKRRATHNGEKA